MLHCQNAVNRYQLLDFFYTLQMELDLLRFCGSKFFSAKNLKTALLLNYTFHFSTPGPQD
jgi:hypothetical protein